MSHQTEAQVQVDGGGVVFWGMIIAEGPNYGSTITEGTVNSDVYTEILDFSKIMQVLILLVSPKKWLKRHGFSLEIVLDWPAQSLDLNPVEHIWHQLIKRRLNTYDTRATTTLELEKRIEKEWYKFTKEDCPKYIDSMSSRIRAAVIKRMGEPIRYYAF
ncbi:hypothetical protein MAM1_0323d09672 [Mucor ambiguus]|uniref:Tc1-like transposase DDE domain-containing protein n=1 Tax=Mucor ambiguus TaxID=91626 RepID=A0A0C9LXJ4_9FUNG|nr:hypothetical protein MAM1_0323d09672 [Mucor ambiguus]